MSVIADYLFTAKARAESVVTVAGPGRRAYGTGMLLRGADLHERFGPGLVLLTSYRVLSGDPAVVEALRPEEAVLMAASSEETPDKLLELDIAKILWSSPPHELGVTVAEVRGDVESLSPLRMTDGVAPGQRAETLYLVGQLATLELSITIQQNLLLHDNGGQLHYRSFGDELLPGASLFDAQWQLIGVHVSANLPCNFCRGISSAGATIQAIKEALGKDFSDVGEVFLCYARKDQVFVMQLAEALHRMRVRIWLDQWSIPDGSNWDAEIDKALERCSRMLIVLSPQAVASEEVRSELRVALDERKPVVPIVHQTCRLPRQLRRTQFIDLTGRDELGEEAISRVLEALRAGTVSEPEV